MAQFPLLKSGSVAQYPLDVTVQSDSQDVWFLDGSRQQYRIARPLRRWKVSLKTIDEQELSALIDFVEQTEGAAFSFTDPVSGYVAAKCTIASGELSATAEDELRNSASLVIEEVA